MELDGKVTVFLFEACSSHRCSLGQSIVFPACCSDRCRKGFGGKRRKEKMSTGKRRTGK